MWSSLELKILILFCVCHAWYVCASVDSSQEYLEGMNKVSNSASQKRVMQVALVGKISYLA